MDDYATTYALRFAPRHLQHAERWDELQGLLTNLSFMEAKIKAGLLFELASDFSDATASIPSDLAQRRGVRRLGAPTSLRELGGIVSRNARFLERHPTCVFQCVANHVGFVTDRPPTTSTGASAPSDTRDELLRICAAWQKKRQDEYWIKTISADAKAPIAAEPLVCHHPAMRFGGAGITCLAVSPTADIFAIAVKNVVFVFDIRTGRERQKLDHDGNVSRMAISPDGKKLVCVVDRSFPTESFESAITWCNSFDNVVTWNVADWTHICKSSLTRTLKSLAFLGDSLIGASTCGASIDVWDYGTEGRRIRLQHCLPEEDEEEAKLSCVALSPDGRFVASASDSCIRIWDLDAGREVASDDFFEGEPREIAFSTTPPLVAFMTDYALFLWDWQSAVNGRRDVEEWPTHCEGDSIAISSDGTRLALGRSVGRVDLWRIAAKPTRSTNRDGSVTHFIDYEPSKENSFEAHAERLVKGIQFIQGSSRFVTTANDGTAKI